MTSKSGIVFSCIIPAKDKNDPKLKELIASIKSQEFPQDQIEILVITQGDSEEAKAIGIRKAKGEICAMFCSDNYLTSKLVFRFVNHLLTRLDLTGAYSRHYDAIKGDNSLNRYFSLIGNNDPIAFYLGKCDRKPWFERLPDEVHWENVCFPYSFMNLPSLGDNGFFVKRHILIENADLDHYYPMDVYVDINKKKMLNFARLSKTYIWHRTSDNLISFLIKRYKYARDLYCERTDRRWKMVDTTQDKIRLALFIFYTLTLIQPILISIKGARKFRDIAWFWHLPVCVGFLITYTILVCRNLIKFQSPFQALTEKKLSSVA